MDQQRHWALLVKEVTTSQLCFRPAGQWDFMLLKLPFTWFQGSKAEHFLAAAKHSLGCSCSFYAIIDFQKKWSGWVLISHHPDPCMNHAVFLWGLQSACFLLLLLWKFNRNLERHTYFWASFTSAETCDVHDRFDVTLLPREPKIVHLLHISSTDVNRDFFVFASPLLILEFFFFLCNTLQDCCFSPDCLWSGCSVWCRLHPPQ